MAQLCLYLQESDMQQPRFHHLQTLSELELGLEHFEPPDVVGIWSSSDDDVVCDKISELIV